jgi:hypothetical protein
MNGGGFFWVLGCVLIEKPFSFLSTPRASHSEINETIAGDLIRDLG